MEPASGLSKLSVAAANERSNSFFHIAVRDNNVGVDFYNKGDYDSSIQYLHRALECMQVFSVQQQQQQQQHQPMQSNHAAATTKPSEKPSGEPWITENSVRNSWDCGMSDRASELAIRGTPPTRESACNGNCCRGGSKTSLPNNKHREMNRCPGCSRDSSELSTVRVDQNSLYRCALYLRCNGDCLEALANPSLSCSGTDQARIKASILFNLGLAHHMKAGRIWTAGAVSSCTQHQRETPSHAHNNAFEVVALLLTLLEQAILLYRLSLGIQEAHEAPISPLYLMALCNNLGQCHSSLSRYDEARFWNERLLRLMVCQRQKDALRKPYAKHGPADCECFIENTMLLILKDPFLSPAA